MVDISKLKQLIDQEIQKEKEAHPFVHQYQDARGNWHVFRTSIYDWKGAIPVVSAIDGDKVKIDWVEPGPAWQTLFTTKQVVYDSTLGHYVYIGVYNRIHPKSQVRQPDLSPKTIEKLNELNEKAGSSSEEQPRIAVKRPWGVEYWRPDLVKQALAEGSLQKSDVLGAVPSDFVVRKNGKVVRETPAVFFKEHSELNPFARMDEELKPRVAQPEPAPKPLKPEVKEIETSAINREELANQKIKEIEMKIGGELPPNLKREIKEALLEGKTVRLSIGSIKLPSFTEYAPNYEKREKEIDELIKELSPGTAMLAGGDKEMLTKLAIYEKEASERSELYKLGAEVEKAGEWIGKKIEELLPFDHNLVIGGIDIGEAVEEGIAGIPEFLSLIPGAILKTAGEAELALKGELPPSPFEKPFEGTYRALKHEAERLKKHPVEYLISTGTALAIGAGIGKGIEIGEGLAKGEVDLGLPKIDLAEKVEGVKAKANEALFGKIEIENIGKAEETIPAKPRGEIIELKPRIVQHLKAKAEIPPESERFGIQMSLEGIPADIKTLEEFKKSLVERRFQDLLKEHLAEEGVISPEEAELISLKPVKEEHFAKSRTTVLEKEKLPSGEIMEVPETYAQVTLPEVEEVKEVKVKRGLFGTKRAKVEEKLSEIKTEFKPKIGQPPTPKESKAYLDVFTPKKTVQTPLPIEEPEAKLTFFPDLTPLKEKALEDLAKAQKEKWENAEILELSPSGEMAKVRFTIKGKGKTYTFEELVPIEEIPEEKLFKFEEEQFGGEELLGGERGALLLEKEEVPTKFEIVKEEPEEGLSLKRITREVKKAEDEAKKIKGKGGTLLLLAPPKQKQKEKETIKLEDIYKQQLKLFEKLKPKEMEKLKLKLKAKVKQKQMQKSKVKQKIGSELGIPELSKIGSTEFSRELFEPSGLNIGNLVNLKSTSSLGTPVKTDTLPKTALKTTFATRTSILEDLGIGEGEPSKGSKGAFKPFGASVKRAKEGGGRKKKEVATIALPDVVPKADWLAVTVTEAFGGKSEVVRRGAKVKGRYKQRLKEFGFGLTFPTSYIERKKIRTPLDITIDVGGLKI